MPKSIQKRIPKEKEHPINLKDKEKYDVLGSNFMIMNFIIDAANAAAHLPARLTRWSGEVGLLAYVSDGTDCISPSGNCFALAFQRHFRVAGSFPGFVFVPPTIY
jgi:hypothetical protein